MLWLIYWLGAVSTLSYKYFRYLYIGTIDGARSWRTVTLEWLFDPSAENKVSWTITLGVVWVGGYLFIHRVDVLMEWIGISESMAHTSVAFLWGGVCEMFAPELAKRLINYINPKLLGKNPEEDY